MCVYAIVYMSIGYPLITWSADKKQRLSLVLPGRASRILPLSVVLRDAEAFELFMLHLVKL